MFLHLKVNLKNNINKSFTNSVASSDLSCFKLSQLFQGEKYNMLIENLQTVLFALLY